MNWRELKPYMYFLANLKSTRLNFRSVLWRRFKVTIVAEPRAMNGQKTNRLARLRLLRRWGDDS